MPPKRQTKSTSSSGHVGSRGKAVKAGLSAKKPATKQAQGQDHDEEHAEHEAQRGRRREDQDVLDGGEGDGADEEEEEEGEDEEVDPIAMTPLPKRRPRARRQDEETRPAAPSPTPSASNSAAHPSSSATTALQPSSASRSHITSSGVRRSTQTRKGRSSGRMTDVDHSADSPVPTTTALVTSAISTSTSTSALASTSTSAPTSNTRPTSRLRSGRRSKGSTAKEARILRMGEDLVVPSDDEEWEEWADKRGKERQRRRAMEKDRDITAEAGGGVESGVPVRAGRAGREGLDVGLMTGQGQGAINDHTGVGAGEEAFAESSTMARMRLRYGTGQAGEVAGSANSTVVLMTPTKKQPFMSFFSPVRPASPPVSTSTQSQSPSRRSRFTPKQDLLLEPGSSPPVMAEARGDSSCDHGDDVGAQSTARRDPPSEVALEHKDQDKSRDDGVEQDEEEETQETIPLSRFSSDSDTLTIHQEPRLSPPLHGQPVEPKETGGVDDEHSTNNDRVEILVRSGEDIVHQEKTLGPATLSRIHAMALDTEDATMEHDSESRSIGSIIESGMAPPAVSPGPLVGVVMPAIHADRLASDIAIEENADPATHAAGHVMLEGQALGRHQQSEEDNGASPSPSAHEADQLTLREAYASIYRSPTPEAQVNLNGDLADPRNDGYGGSPQQATSSPVPSPVRNSITVETPSRTATRSPIGIAPETFLTPLPAMPALQVSPAHSSPPAHHPTSSPDALDLLTRPPAPRPPPPTPPEPEPVPAQQPDVDPALQQFRSARTFRTRTTLQLQPYTRERQLYEAVLRQGGLKKGKKAIAPVREISPSEEDNEDEAAHQGSSGDMEVDPEQIVIGDTQTIPPRRRERSPVPLIEADYDEYYLRSGFAPEQEDENATQELQKIARLRLRTEKEEKRRAREAQKAKRDFERLIKEAREGRVIGDPVAEEPPSTSTVHRGRAVKTPRPPAIASRDKATKTPGRLITYKVSNRSRPAHVRSSSESDVEAGLQVASASRRSPSLVHDLTSTPSLVQPLSSFNGGDTPGHDYHDWMPDYQEHNLDADQHVDFDNDAFLVNDMPPRNIPSLSRPGSESGSDDSSPEDRRAKIARRMLPAAMLRRLERESEKRERRDLERKRKEQRKAVESPLRPGRAVTRRANGGVDVDGLLEMVAEEGEESDGSMPYGTGGVDMGKIGAPNPGTQAIVISSDESSGSQAEEDNGGHGGGIGAGESLAQLYRGDFESLVAGRGRTHPAKKRHRHQRAMDADRRVKRPPLGLVKRTNIALSKGNKAMLQTRLSFPAETEEQSRSPRTKKRKSSSRHGYGQTTPQTARARPAIRLNDETIFATADFAFDTENDSSQDIREVTPSRPAKRPLAKVVVRPDVVVESLDAGVGKARSWAYLDKLSVDFGITPLPSGLYCAVSSIPGSGRLASLVDRISGVSQQNTGFKSYAAAYGIELYDGLMPNGVAAVVPIIFDKLYEAVLAYINADDTVEVNLEPLEFLAGYLVKCHDDLTDLKSEIVVALSSLSERMDSLQIPGGKAGKDARRRILELQWAMFELSCDLRLPSLTETLATGLLRQLLESGFDKAIRPLKRILRGESDTGEIDDDALTLWVALTHALPAIEGGPGFISCLCKALDATFHLDQVGPIAAERIWYLVFGLCALSQFDVHGKISSDFTPSPKWSLVRRAVSLIKISHNEEAEEGAHLDQLYGRDRYIKVMVARCTRLSSIWRWSFDRESFSIVTKDLGIIFKDRQYRNLPTEPPVDFPSFITQYDMSLTAAPDSKRESTFELYLRLVCVAASDLISASESMAEAQQAEKDVQRLVMAIMPVSPVKFNRILPPSAKQLGQLINRYSTMVAACYFSPSLLGWLLACSKKWVAFELADFDSRQVSIRGLMYLAVACRHHGLSLQPVVARLAEILGCLQKELDKIAKEAREKDGSAVPHQTQMASRMEVERTMVLVVSCVRQIILHHSYDKENVTAVYPDPCLLDQSWTTRVFSLDLPNDLSCSTEVVATIQAFLDVRAAALPPRPLAGEERERESQDEFGSLGFELDEITLARLGGGGEKLDLGQKQDEVFATILEEVICPRIYRLLSDLLPPINEGTDSTPAGSAEKVAFLAKLTKCFSDCAAILVIDHRKLDWSSFVGPFGKMSWSRIGDEVGRTQVGLHFMLNVALIDRASFSALEEEFISLLIQSLVANKLDIEHEYVDAVLSMPGAKGHVLLRDVRVTGEGMDKVRFMEFRSEILRVIFANLSTQLTSRDEWATARKPFFYRCMNLLVSALVSNDKSIHPARVLHKEEYRAFALGTILDLKKAVGDNIVIPQIIPALKYFT